MEVVTGKAMESIGTEMINTELGHFPNEWQSSTLEELCDFITKGSTPTTYGFDWQSSGVKFLRSECVSEFGLDLNPAMHISKEANQLLKRSQVQSGDILMTITGNVGRVIYLDKSFGKGNINQHIARVRVNTDKVDTQYVFQFLSRSKIKKYFYSILTGQAYPQISLKQVRELPIYFPKTLEEQHAIAEALSDTDALIAEFDALIEKKQQVKKGAMQLLLTGKKRLSGFDGEWEKKKLGEFTDIRKGDLITKSTAGHGDIPVIAGGKTISYYHSKANRDANTITISASGAYAGYVSFHKKPIFASDCSTITESEVYDIEFLYFKLCLMQEQIYDLQSGGAQPHVYPKHLANLSLKIAPSVEEQKAIARILSDMEKEIQALQAKRDKYKKVKLGMMQELLTGKTRLTKKERESRKVDGQSKPSHNWEFDEAVLVSVLADRFGTKDFPLGRFRRTKYSYLVRRYLESKVDQFLKKAAGPYNPKTRYSGPETIALNNEYVQNWKNKKRTGFIADENIEQAWTYFEDWYGQQVIDWLEGRFRYAKNKELELLTTVDKARIELEEENREVTLSTVKEVIESHPEWQPKLERDLFSDENIEEAIKESFEFFG